MPNLVIKMMMSYLMTAEQTTLSVRERIGNYMPLFVSYSAERYESSSTIFIKWEDWFHGIILYLFVFFPDAN